MEILQWLLCLSMAITLTFVQAQDQAGFISLDCGFTDEPSYVELSTGLRYTSDENYVKSGQSGRIKEEFEPLFDRPFFTLRYFPDGRRNCYNINVTKEVSYTIKATFVYGNYDGLNIDPKFDLYLGPSIWERIDLTGKGNGSVMEIIHATKSNTLQICLVKTGTSTPMISALELRPLPKDSYVTQGSSLKRFFRVYISNAINFIRYPDDVYDRKWTPYFQDDWTQINTTLETNTKNSTYKPPEIAMTSAAITTNASLPLTITWTLTPPTVQFYMYVYFVELQTLRANETREFNVSTNGNMFGPYRPQFLRINILSDKLPQQCDEGSCSWQLIRTPNSTLPPLVNAIEAYTVIEFPQSETNQDDVNAIKGIQDTYDLSRISWQGDPCVPKLFSWDGLNCSRDTDVSIAPRIISLKLSSSGLSGTIAPWIKNLTQLQELDLSNNSLTGGVPEFLTGMKSLSVINLSGNNLNGSVPQGLLDRQNKGLELKLDGNPKLLCQSVLCDNDGGNVGHQKKNVPVPVVASVASVAVLIAALVLIFILRKKKQSKGNAPSVLESMSSPLSSQPSIVAKNRKFTYSEVTTMTNNFQRILGKGGFGVVYHGLVNHIEQVAVKLLSQSSSQGYKQFKAEVELLLRVHHKNLVSLVGYCEEGAGLALIYEYMANGDLNEHLSGKRGNLVLSWGTRLKIAVESAQGLEYLHNGCKPPMVHRDVKTTNILLDEHLQAKVADFGLSRSFPITGQTHVSTVVAGTPGYLDPEYYRTNWLTEKSDVYSFGIVLLEIVTNRPVIDQNREKRHIAEWVGAMLMNGNITEIMDPKLCGDYDTNGVWKVVELAMSCVNPSSVRRPKMSQVVIELNESLASENMRLGTSQNMDSKGSVEVSYDSEVVPKAR